MEYDGDELDPDYDASYVVDLEFDALEIEREQRGWRGEIAVEPTSLMEKIKTIVGL